MGFYAQERNKTTTMTFTYFWTHHQFLNSVLFTTLCHICSLSLSVFIKCKTNSFSLCLTSLCCIMNTGNFKNIRIYPFSRNSLILRIVYKKILTTSRHQVSSLHVFVWLRLYHFNVVYIWINYLRYFKRVHCEYLYVIYINELSRFLFISLCPSFALSRYSKICLYLFNAIIFTQQ